VASNLVVVALPSQGDSVWQVSSEKAPHLTVLFLGDAMSNPNVSKIVDYVKEQASRLEPFSLLVDHRGTLGPDEADVLFFTKDIPWQLVDFRETLKYNQEISMAYNAIPQRQDWKPHLTLGYPETPAKPDDWDPMGTQYVSFDKVAVWYGDSEGSEFPLTPNPKPSMSKDIAAWAQQIGNDLAHHGIKGMRWGVRRSKQELAVSDDSAKAAAAKTKAKEQGPQALSNKEMRDLVTRMQLEQQLKNVTPATRTQKGAKFAANLLVNTGKQQAQMIVNDQVNKQIKKALGG
jgi:2'-5' RNA ligase